MAQIEGLFEYRKRKYKYTVDLEEIPLDSVLRMFYCSLTNPEGMTRHFYWNYRKESLHEKLEHIIHLTSPMLENRPDYKRK